MWQGELGRAKKLTCDGETTESPLLLEGLGLADGGLTADDNGVEDKTVLIALDLADKVGLGLGRAVVVDDTETTLKGHVDGHLVLGDGVHGRGHERGLQADLLGDLGVESDGRGREANVAGENKEVVIGETAMGLGVHELMDTEAIATLVLVEHLLGLAPVKNLVGRHFCALTEICGIDWWL